MTLYSRRTFSKESFQWTKCVVKYLYDHYSNFSFNMLGFLVEVLEKGSSNIQGPVMTIIHCLLHYVDMGQATQVINSDLLSKTAKFVEVRAMSREPRAVRRILILWPRLCSLSTGRKRSRS